MVDEDGIVIDETIDEYDNELVVEDKDTNNQSSNANSIEISKDEIN